MTLDEFEKLAAEARPGPWKAVPCFSGPECWCEVVDDGTEDGVVPAAAVSKGDARFIAASRELAPKLIAVARAAQALANAYDPNERSPQNLDDEVAAIRQALTALGVDTW